ncbi:MAG: inhibitor of the KinA pathway to sporulation [Parcubacteria group bacterium Gr01-1014_66]|nr:MAG: inhibitor of the KinA pathway to sporulation [Parcubacteria group bacterium Gr01-1014_66]
MNLPEQFVIADIEYTCWEGSMERNWSEEWEKREIVEIGAVRVKGSTLEEIHHFLVIVKPRINPILSTYFIALTGIEQERVDREGAVFPEAMKQFTTWVGDDLVFAWGMSEGGDWKVLEENCGFHAISFPLADKPFINAGDVFVGHGIAVENYTSGTIVEAFGEKPIRRPHDGLNDARTILDGLRFLRNA